jgi:uncharacterized protein (DUF849 family)
MNRVIITAAITGSIHTPSMSAYLPITPDEIAEEAIRSHGAGAAIVHIHVRDPEDGRPSSDQSLYREVLTKIKAETDLVVCITTGGGLGQTTDERVVGVKTFRPELASLNAGSINFALFHALDNLKSFKYEWERGYLSMTEDFIFPNTFKTLREFNSIFNELGTKPEFEIYDIGMINNLAFLIQKGLIKKPVYLQFVMGILGGIPATIENLVFLKKTATDLIGDFEWSVCAAGKNQFRLCTAAMLMGGHSRVGLEDNLYLEKGVMAKSNAEQVEKIVRISKEFGLETATPDEARQILHLRGLNRVDF